MSVKKNAAREAASNHRWQGRVAPGRRAEHGAFTVLWFLEITKSNLVVFSND
jgi:hypothetical protein